jgi:predicted ArsR family transcriptional regulator
MALSNEQPNRQNGDSVPNDAPGVALARKLNLPEEVSSQQAAEILGCSKHTVLRYMETGLLEWRNLAPPDSGRPVFRFSLRSVLDIRLGYQRGSPATKPEVIGTLRRRTTSAHGHQIKHIRRKRTGK